jgi:hypothetical protein
MGLAFLNSWQVVQDLRYHFSAAIKKLGKYAMNKNVPIIYYCFLYGRNLIMNFNSFRVYPIRHLIYYLWLICYHKGVVRDSQQNKSCDTNEILIVKNSFRICILFQYTINYFKNMINSMTYIGV